MERKDIDDPLSSDTFSLRKLGRLLVHNVSTLRERPAVVNLYSERPEDVESLRYLASYLGRRFQKLFGAGNGPSVRITAHPDSQFAFDLGYFLKAERMPVQLSPPLGDGREEYYPVPPEKRILGYIVNGTTVDHIPAGMVWNLITPLGLNRFSGRASIGDNYWSRRMDKKGILKIEGHEFDERERGIVGVYAPDSTICLISGGVVYRKFKAETPEFLEGVISCPSWDCRRDSIHYSPVEKRFRCNSCSLIFDLGDLVGK